eukprot:CAMPEP_0170538766 /NCGR_PEP_ID=MMETSP0209-20121228/103515_1 /TAXON_ID=665100 ORGANISM="Litonotus pictus, Strain P1" /NCGR_SAMPLE_ID=MMETSP0209 /ASSEMBLY_ACC=CAM_ASM_000301 /LENGTH=421 /DNA_ID=CAMNT_0010840531 /DNA_START=61 /DNA_END=1323 /DNA_ORIENTATION=-
MPNTDENTDYHQSNQAQNHYYTSNHIDYNYNYYHNNNQYSEQIQDENLKNKNTMNQNHNHNTITTTTNNPHSLIEYNIPNAPRNIYLSNPHYNLSHRMINDENTKISYRAVHYNKEKIKMIEDIVSGEKKRQFLSARKYLSMPDKACFTLIHMLLDQYTETTKAHNLVASKFQLTLVNLLNTKAHNLVASKFQLTLVNLLNTSIESFRSIYGDVLELQEYYFQAGVFVKNKVSMNLPVLDLVLRSKVVNNKSYLSKGSKVVHFSSAFKVNRHCNTKNKKKRADSDLVEEVIHSWKFDVRAKKKQGTWFASEAEEFRKLIVRHCYSQPVKSFVIGDTVEIKINVLSSNGSIIPDSVSWLDMVVTGLATEDTFLDYHKGIRMLSTPFDSLRFCELENAVHIWKDHKGLTKKHHIEEFSYLFSL